MNEPFVRRNRVDERIALAVAAVGGVAAVFAGAEPTGSTIIDALLVFVAVGVAVWASASAPWWAPAAAAGIAAVIALDPLLTGIAAAAFGVGLYIGVKQRDQSALRAGVAAVALNVLIRSELDGFLGLSAIIGIGVGAALFVLGVRRRPAAIRRIGWMSTIGVGAVAGVALLALAVSATSARPDLSRGASDARQAIDVLNSGDYERAADLFESSSIAFARSDDRLGGVLALPSRLIPGVAQNVRAGADLSTAAAAGTADAAAALRAIDPSTLQVVDGAIDIEAIKAVEAPLLRVQGVLGDLRQVSESVRSPWLIAPVQEELADLDDRLDKNEPRLVNAVDAVRLSPQILGADGMRRYMIMFTTPAELRGITGFMGNYADVTIDNGRISVTKFGRWTDLGDFVDVNGATCTGCPPEFIGRYGPYGMAMGPELEFRRYGWQNITMPGHFPYVAETTSIVYPQSGGSPIDGVIAMDPYVLQALMAYTGPVAVPEFDLTLAPEDAATFILEDQYVLAGSDRIDDRIDALDTIGQQVIESLLRGALPVPSELARDLGPLVAEQRLLVWTSNPEEQELFDRIGMLGALPEMGDDGGFGVTVTNGGNSKIDVFLERETDVRVETDPDGRRILVAEVTLRNNAPPSGLPPYVIGNSRDLPEGTSRMLVTLYGPAEVRSLLRDGEPVEVDVAPEAGWTAYSRNEDVLPGDSVSFRVEFELGPAIDATDEPVEWFQPLAKRTAG